MKRALAIKEQELGPRHPSTKIGRDNYAGMLREHWKEKGTEGRGTTAALLLDIGEIFQGQDASQQGVDIGSAGGDEVIEVGQGDLEGGAVFAGFEFATEGLAADSAFALSGAPGGFHGADELLFKQRTSSLTTVPSQ